MQSTDPHVQIYTDGACSGNPGPGGWAAILRFGDISKEISGYEEDTTNNRMELRAALEALKLLKVPCKVDLHSDSSYLVNAFNQGWLRNWQRNGWKNAAGQAVSNPDLWKALLEMNDLHTIRWIKVKGHADDPLNNRCDEMAVAEIKKESSVVAVEYELLEKKISDEILYHGRIFDVHRLRVILPDGKESDRDIITHSGGAAVVALTDDNQLVMVRQYRIAVGKELTEIPAGKLETGEDPLLCAQRELEEESGYRAEKWFHLNSSYPSPGYTSEKLHLYLARELSKTKAHPDEGEFLEAVLTPIDEVIDLIRSGDITDAKTIIAVLLAAEVLKEEGQRADGRR